MTNAMIILLESVKLMENGIISGTGKFAEIERKTESGTETVKIELPEEIHTYAAWKARGRQVKRGEKCKARFCIWKQGKGKTVIDEDGNETEKAGRMFMKESFFFTIAQTEPIAVRA